MAKAAPEAALDARTVLAEMPGLLAGDAQYAIAKAGASSSGWSVTLGASDPIERSAGARADGAAVVEYQEHIFVPEPVFIEGFADVVAVAGSTSRISVPSPVSPPMLHRTLSRA